MGMKHVGITAARHYRHRAAVRFGTHHRVEMSLHSFFTHEGWNCSLVGDSPYVLCCFAEQRFLN